MAMEKDRLRRTEPATDLINPGERRLQNAHHVVAIVGSGPAGVETAKHFAQQGIPVDLFDATAGIGGTLRTGHTPGKRRDGYLKLLHDAVDSRPDIIRFFPSVRFDDGDGNVPFETLMGVGYSGIVIATGAQREIWPNIDEIENFQGRGVVFYANVREAITRTAEEKRDWRDLPYQLFDRNYEDYADHAKLSSGLSEERIPLNLMENAIVYGGEGHWR